MTPYEAGKLAGDKRAKALGLTHEDRRTAYHKARNAEPFNVDELDLQEFAYCGLVIYTDGLGTLGAGSWSHTAPERQAKQNEYAKGYYALT